jgi:hypothetical protein
MNSSLVQVPIRALNSLLDWLATPRWLIGSSLLRICLGFIAFVFFALHIPDRYYYWGPNGLVSLGEFWQWFGGMQRLGPNVYAVSTSLPLFEALFWSGLVVTLLFTLGLWTRFMTPLFAIAVWSLYHRDPWITNGGTRLLCIVVVYLLVADLGSRFSIDAWLRRTATSAPANAYSTMLHNTSMILIIVQLCIVYIFSTIYKLDGPAWQQGTGLYYALLDPEFNVSPLVGLVTQNALLITAGSYGTLLYQSAFPWLILHPRLKYPMIGIGLLFHLGIAIMMGLWWFSAVLISCETVLLTDDQYARVWSALKSLFAVPRRTATIGAAIPDPG